MEFTHASLTYAGTERAALRDITLRVDAHEKVGVVGRTGAGKSSLLTALFRLHEMTGTAEGCVRIDGVDIARVGLFDLRHRMSIIPVGARLVCLRPWSTRRGPCAQQDPFLFTGTLRFNLDPFGQRTDAQLWDALARSELKATVERLPGTLDFAVVSARAPAREAEPRSTAPLADGEWQEL